MLMAMLDCHVVILLDIITRTRPYIHEWDVINEPLDNYDVQGQVASPGVTQSNGVLGNSFSADLFDYWYIYFYISIHVSCFVFYSYLNCWLIGLFYAGGG